MSGTLFYDNLVLLAGCLATELEAAGTPKPCFIGVLPDELAVADYCNCETNAACGMAWVRLANIVPVPNQNISGISPVCLAPLQATVEVGVLRCAPMPDANGNPPTEEAQLEAVILSQKDMEASLRAVCGCLNSRDFSISDWSPVGSSGGCLGGRWLVTVQQS